MTKGGGYDYLQFFSFNFFIYFFGFIYLVAYLEFHKYIYIYIYREILKILDNKNAHTMHMSHFSSS
jgi:hypothetical protein